MFKRLVFSLVFVAMIASCSGSSAPQPRSPLASIPAQVETSDTTDRYMLHNLADMRVGESGYIVPWAMWLDTNGKWWLNPRYYLFDPAPNTYYLPIVRTKRGYVVTMKLSAHERKLYYEPVKEPYYVGQEGLTWIPARVVRK